MDQGGGFKVLKRGEMAFLHLDIRCLYTILLSTTFGCIFSSTTELKVNPPQHFEIVDLGYLGYLSLQWKPPLTLDDFKDCAVEYELKCRNNDSEDWKTIITKKLSYRVGFDLNKGIEAKIRTILPEQCANGSNVQSSWLEATYWTPSQGNVATRIQDMDCVYNNWQYLSCSWKPGVNIPLDTNYYLFYWYDGLDQAAECAEYLKANGTNIGCRFPSLESADYKDFYICVNGSSESMSIMSNYFIFQLQNIVKPLPPHYFLLIMNSSGAINLKWTVPRGPIPARCFIYEISLREDDSTWMSCTVDNEIFTKRMSNKSHQICISVRSKVNMFCSDDGIWSEWTEEKCWRDNRWKETWAYSMLPLGFASLFLLSTLLLFLYNRQALLKTILNSNKEVFTQQETCC
ncbi:interleukin-13 receptor subunit alpha-2 [Echinops telfairi]|uniref:Interleukin-13 receptor subunit alpha-2 n=1 Tax=Echinops telfairi TaxID=9371 RepID=A0ABM0IXL8_ECHTE|nr:interleukin-13 receptor subunit alpha-2 [Echinops telfairi]